MTPERLFASLTIAPRPEGTRPVGSADGTRGRIAAPWIARHAILGAAVLTALAPCTARAQAVEHPFSFSLLPGRIPPLVHPRFAWGDVDGDGDLDLVAMGVRLDGAARSVYSAVLRNDGPTDDVLAPGGRSIAFTPIPLPVALAHGDLDLGDIDRDGDLDLVVTGSATHLPPYLPQTHLYRNDAGTFTDTGVPLPAVFGGAVRLADVDRDGDLDLVLTGAGEASAPYTPTARVLRQTGAWTFSDVGSSGLPGHAFGEARMLDADGDGDPDVLLGGVTSEGLATRLYLNTGGTFEAAALALPAGTLARLDAVRRNGRLDVAVTAGAPSPIGLEGRGALLLGASALRLDPLVGGTVRWTDHDDDGDDDLVVAGRTRLDGATVTRVLRRNGAETFDLAGYLEGLRDGATALGDVDGDGDLDLVASGVNRAGVVVGALYRNDRWGRATTPSQPRGLVGTDDAGGVRVRWEPVAGAAGYDVRVGTTPGGHDLVSPAAAADGRRLVAMPGPVAEPSFWLPSVAFAGRAALYVGVQSVSAGYVGSAFSEVAVTPATTTAVNTPTRATTWALDAPAPSPLAGAGRVRVSAPTDADAVLTLVDGLGRTVARLHDGRLAAGVHDVAVDVAPLPTGLYVLRLTTPSGTYARPLVVVH